MPIIAIGLVAAAALSGGVSVAATQSLPGDMLYGVKLGINEQIRGAFALSDEAQAQWHLKTMDRRLSEATEVAARGEFEAGARVTLEENFISHAERLEQITAQLEAEGKSDTSARIATETARVLTAHSPLLMSAHAEAYERGDRETQKLFISLVPEVTAALTAAALVATQGNSGGADLELNGALDLGI